MADYVNLVPEKILFFFYVCQPVESGSVGIELCDNDLSLRNRSNLNIRLGIFYEMRFNFHYRVTAPLEIRVLDVTP